MDQTPPTPVQPAPVPRLARLVAVGTAAAIVGQAVLGLLVAPHVEPGPFIDWFARAVRPDPSSQPVIGRPSIWMVPALELVAAALILWRGIAIRSERRTWLVFGSAAVGLAVAHLCYRMLLPPALAGRGSLTSVQLGLGVHLVQLLYFSAAFLTISLMTTRRIGLPTPGVRLDGLIGGCGVLTIGTALLVPDSMMTAATGWAEVGAVLVAIGAFAPIALLVGLVPVSGRAPSRVWWSMFIGSTLGMIAAATAMVPLAIGADGRLSPGWLLWPTAILSLAWTAWNAQLPAQPAAAHSVPSIVTPTVFALGAVGVLIVDRVLPQPTVVLVLAFLTVLMSIVRMTFALRSAKRLNAHHLVQRERLRDARDEALAASRARTDFTATLSHEIRTPLNAVIGMSELLMASKLDPVQQEQIGHVRRSGMLILELVHDVLERATLDADELTLEYQPFELAEVLGDVVELLQVNADTKGIRLRADLDPACPEWVRGDATRLRQVLINLVGNAVKFTDTGEVTVEVCPAARLEHPEAVYFQVTDTGTGIPATHLDRVFQPYIRVQQTGGRRRAGTGLGLSISQALVRRMGGEIVVTSQEGVGSVFGFELVLPPQPIPETVAATLQGRRITVVDCQPSRAAGLAAQLHRWGAVVTVGPSVESWWTDQVADTVVVREDHPDALATLGAQLGRHAPPDRPALMIITASPHAVPGDGLGPADVVLPVTTTGGRLRASLSSIGPATDADPTEPEPEARPLRILLAEDDPASRRVCQLMVQQLGHEIDLVADGSAAVAAAASIAYDLVLMDSQMPVLDGVDATRAIRTGEAPGERVPVIALTGAVSEANRQTYTAAGMDGMLAKPFSRADLADLLSDVPRRAAVESYAGTGMTP